MHATFMLFWERVSFSGALWKCIRVVDGAVEIPVKISSLSLCFSMHRCILVTRYIYGSWMERDLMSMQLVSDLMQKLVSRSLLQAQDQPS